MNELEKQSKLLKDYQRMAKEQAEGLELALRIARYLLKHTTAEHNIRKQADEQLREIERKLVPPF